MKFLIALSFLFTSITATAQSRIVSVDAFDLSYTGGMAFRHDDGRKVKDRNETLFRLNLNYAQAMPEYVGLMWKAEFHWNREEVDWGSSDALRRTFGGSGGFLYNVNSSDIKNSFLIGAQAGLEHMALDLNNNDETGFNLYMKVEAGKRWDLGRYSAANISYAPTIDLMLKRYGGNVRDEYFKSGREIRLNFLKFDILF